MARFVNALGRDGVMYRINLDQVRHIAQHDGFQRVHYAAGDMLEVGAVHIPTGLVHEDDFGD